MSGSPPELPPLFFFGTLMDPDILGLVIGRRVEEGELEPARLTGFRRVRVAGASYPMLVPDPEASVEGRLWRGGTASERARLDAYEGPGYRLEPVVVEARGGERVEALVYRAVEGALRPSGEPWELALWQARFKPLYLARGEDLLGAELP
ncbi:MAG: gamma-glutamylcyclotransferase [Geminicoccaceae bacterium]|nr:gamma-glutamylcyclotransferase [Geminicoccaceae bacterium]